MAAFRSDPAFGLLMNYHQTPSNTFNQGPVQHSGAPTIIDSPDVLDDDDETTTTTTVFLTDVDLLAFIKSSDAHCVER
jgi:hypothetical protein